MAILYALVARGSVVLTEFSTTSTTTTANSIARQILEKLSSANHNTNVSYSQDRYIFHVKRSDGLTVLCMAEDTAQRRIPFAFLEDIHQRFVQRYGRAVLSAQAYEMNDEFSRVLSQQMDYYSKDPNADRINRIKGEMSQVLMIIFIIHFIRVRGIYEARGRLFGGPYRGRLGDGDGLDSSQKRFYASRFGHRIGDDFHRILGTK
ncbi:hypothetical protein OROGR_012776 [Orobanche gracilis]